MKEFIIHKAPREKDFTGIQTSALGHAVGDLKHSALRIYLYLAGNQDKFKFTWNSTAYAHWIGIECNQKSLHAISKSFNDGIVELMNKGYVRLADGKELYEFSELPRDDWKPEIKDKKSAPPVPKDNEKAPAVPNPLDFGEFCF